MRMRIATFAFASTLLSTTPASAVTTHRLAARCEARQWGVHLEWYKAEVTYQHVGTNGRWRRVTAVRLWKEKNAPAMTVTKVAAKLTKFDPTRGRYTVHSLSTRMHVAGWHILRDTDGDPRRGLIGLAIHEKYGPDVRVRFVLDMPFRPDAACSVTIPLWLT